MGTTQRLAIDITATNKTAAAFNSVQKLMSPVATAQAKLASFSAPMQKAAANSNQFATGLQNVSFQVQDFAVQVAAGTSVTQAFAQQAPQLLSGFGLLGTVLGTVAAVAIPLAGYFLSTADAMGSLGGVMQQVAPYAAVATAALAGFYAPALLSGVAMTTSAIGVGLVGAVKAVTAAMMANPLGLLVAGVATAAVAIFAFRDDLKQVFGVDFVGAIKDATNWAVDKLVKLSQSIGATWSHIGDVIGNAMVGAANYVVSAIAGMVNVGIQGVNKLIGAINSLSEYTGVTLETFAEIGSYEFENPYASGAAKAGEELGRIWAQTQVKDYVGTMGALAGGAMSKVTAMFSGSGALNSATPVNNQFIPPSTIDDVYGAGEAVRVLGERLQETAAYSNGLSSSFASSLSFALNDVAFNARSIGEAFDMLKQSAMSALQSITKQLLNSGLNMLLKGLMPGGGLLGAQGLGNFGGFYANGGTLGAGKWGIAGENGPEIIHGPAGVTPISGRSGGIVVKNNIINNSGAQVQTRATQNNDGSINIETFVEDKVIDALGGGRAARVMGGRYGARIMPRRT